MKKGWEIKELGEICNTPQNINWTRVDASHLYQYIDLSAVERESCSIVGTTSINKDNAPSRAKQVVNTGDILFGTTRPLLKRVCVVPKENNENICSTGFCVLRPNQDCVKSKWIYFHLLNNKFYSYLEPLQSGANYPAVSDRIVKSYKIPVPSLSEQDDIISELDSLSSVLEKKKSQLSELDNLAQSIFFDIFGDPVTNDKDWDFKPFKNLFVLKSGDSLSSKDLIEGPYPVYGGNGISGYHNQYNKEGSYIIIGRVGVYCGNVRAVSNKFWLTDNAFELIYDYNLFNRTYLSHLLRHINLNKYANHAAQPVISNIVLKDIEIPLPPLSLQQAFAEKMEAIEAMKAKIRQSLEESENLFNARIDYYFN